MTEVSQKAVEIIKKVIYLNIASVCGDGRPWNTPVATAYDERLNFYWVSDKEGQHSKNIRNNENVFLTIYDSNAPEGTGEGVFMQGQAYELNDEEEIKVSRLNRRGGGPEESEYKEFTGDGVRRIYKAVPKRVWINDVEEDERGNFIRDIRIEIPIEDIVNKL